MSVLEEEQTWYEEDISDDDSEYLLKEYEIISSPNDFNIKTIFDFISSGVVIIPGFQRHYVWDINRASRLIESIIIGLPIPQIFLYEQERNKFLVIDGQQRLMSIYFFMTKRFPKQDKRVELRQIFNERGKIPENIFYDDTYFTSFDLKLPDKENALNGLNYATLEEHKIAFELRTIRNVILKQTNPDNENTSIYEIYNRLNSGGINLKPQEIRASLYESDFYKMLYRVNLLPKWREILGLSEPDINMRDIEFILRGFALLLEDNKYKPSMARFLDSFSKNCRNLSEENILYLEKLFVSFLESCSELDKKAFWGKTGKFNISIFESVFRTMGLPVYKSRSLISRKINGSQLEALKTDTDFIGATLKKTTSKSNVQIRLNKAEELLSQTV